MTTLLLGDSAVEWSTPPGFVDASTVPDGSSTWALWVTERDGTKVAQLTTANVGTWKRTINQPASIDFTVAVTDAALTEVRLVEREVQLYQGGHLVFTGVVLPKKSGSGSGRRTFAAVDPRWYLNHCAYPEEAWNREWIMNPRYDDGLDRWIHSGVTLDADHETGTQSAVIAADGMLRQNVQIPLAIDYHVVVQARVKVPAAATGSLGLVVEVPGTFQGDGYRQFPIAADTPRDEWTTLLVELDVYGRAAGREVQVTVHGDGDEPIQVDRMSLTLLPPAIIAAQLTESMEASRTISIDGLVKGAPAAYNLGVATEGAALEIPFSGWHDRYIGEIIATIIADGHYDVALSVTPRTRTVRDYFGGQGVEHDPEDLTLRFSAGPGCEDERGNLKDYDDDLGGDLARSRVIMLGENGYRASARDSDAWGGLPLDEIIKAPTGTPLDQLAALADAELRSSLGMVQRLKVTTRDLSLLHTIGLGDRIPIVVDDWEIHYDALYRVIDIEVDCAAGRMTIMTNEHNV